MIINMNYLYNILHGIIMKSNFSGKESDWNEWSEYLINK